MIYICDDINIDYPYEELEKHVSMERLIKALRYNERIDYALSLTAYCLLKYGLYKEIGHILPDYTTFEYYEHNKPKVQGVDKKFNMTHSHKCVAAAISDFEVGIDVEGEKNITDNLINFTMNKNEIIKIKADKSNFYRYWTNKESYLKLTGQGINVILTSLDLSSFSDSVFTYKDAKFYTETHEGYSLSVCSFEETFSEKDVVRLSFKELLKAMEDMTCGNN